jgi:hypothetical protein
MDSIPFLQSLGYMGAVSPEVENIIGAGTGLSSRRKSEPKEKEESESEPEILSDKPPRRVKPVLDLTKEEQAGINELYKKNKPYRTWSSAQKSAQSKIDAFNKADDKFRKSRGVVGLVKSGGKQVPVFDPTLHTKQYYSNK